MARKQITHISLIPIDGVYYPTRELTEAEQKAAQGYTNKPVSAERISADKLAEWSKKATEKVSDALSRYYSSHVDEYKGV
ncbi:MAG: hypothetical protein J6Y64_04650 [Ruminococcus sp.]|nr:hypothetical protein [Ruminococcus sp.]